MRTIRAAFALIPMLDMLPAMTDVLTVVADRSTGDVPPGNVIGGPATGLRTAVDMSDHGDDRSAGVADFRGQRAKVVDSAETASSGPRPFSAVRDSSPAVGSRRYHARSPCPQRPAPARHPAPPLALDATGFASPMP